MNNISKQLKNIICSRDGGDILDFGTGGGRFVRLLMESFGSWKSITGVDINDPLQRIDRDLVYYDNIQWLEIENSLPLLFEDEQFDTVSIARTIHHIHPDKRLEVLLELKRILKPGGLFILDEVISDTSHPAQETQMLIHHFRAEIDQAIGVGHYCTMYKKDLSILYDKLGLTPYAEFEHRTKRPDYQKKQFLDSMALIFERHLMSAVGAHPYNNLKEKWSKLKERMYTTGYMGANSVVFVGEK